MTSQDFTMITKSEPEKSLTTRVQKHAGRNSAGRITTRHQGGGVKNLYRLVDFVRQHDSEPATVVAVEYDPYRSARIALIQYTSGKKSYILAPLELKVGDVVRSGAEAPIRPGNTLPLSAIPLGVQVHNIELTPGNGGQIGRSAGIAVTLLAKEGKFATIKLASGELRKVLLTCRASIGQIGNILHSTVIIGKAGRHRLMGKKPAVRGKAMSPRDHPHGGGEGVNSIGLRRGPKTPWGALALGVKTRKKKKTTSVFVVSKRKR
jgi:large subunit ribosomal protein L2